MVNIVNVLGPSNQADDNAPLPVAAIPTQGGAFRDLQRLVLGERAVLTDWGITAPPTYDVQSHEWGLGYDPQSRSWILVRGGPGATKYVGNGLPAVIPYAHTHPTDPNLPGLAALDLNGLDQQAGLVGLTARTLADVCSWLVTNSMMIDAINGLAPLFPSNADVIANYTIGADRTATGGRVDRRPRTFDNVQWPAAGVEIIYPTCFLDQHGWISGTALHNHPLQVTFGPAKARLVANAATNGLTDAALLDRLFAPVELASQGHSIWRGAIEIDPAHPHGGWLRNTNQIPPGLLTRAEAAVTTQNRS